MNNKGMSQYIAWILLIGMAVALGVVMYSWTHTFTQKQVDDLETRTDSVLCESVSFDVSGACQNSQTLNINVTNTNNLRIENLQFLFLDLYGNSETQVKNIKLTTSDTLKVSVLKQGTIASVRITPTTLKDGKGIVCQERSIILENIGQC